MPSQQLETRKAGKVAANAKTLEAREAALAVERGHAGELDGQIAAVHRPVQLDAAERVARSQRLAHACVGIEPERIGDLAPRPAHAGLRQRTDQFQEFVGAERETILAVGLPLEAQRI